MFRNVITAAALAAFALVGSSPAGAGQQMPESLHELAAAPRIVIAEVQAAQSRWNVQGTLIVTDYTFRRVEILRGNFNEIFVLTQGGGTVGEETHQLSDLPVLRSGARYLLVLNRDDNPVFSSVRYGAAGALEIDVAAGRTRGGISVQEFRDAARHTAVIDDDVLRGRSTRSYPAAEYRRDEVVYAGPAQRPLVQDAVVPPLQGDAGPAVAAGFAEALSLFVPDYVVQRAPAPFVTFNPLPLDWVWSPSDQNMMAEWNRYGDVFRVFTTPTGTWAWGNNRYDLAGFPSNADMQTQFGAPWGATTLAICYSRWNGSGPIIESDIALNPAYDWTLDDAFGSEDGSSPWSFRQSLEHELGHSWGLQHPWETQNVFWPSTMNYGPKWARNPRLHSDDSAGIRAAYPGISLHDGSLSMYSTSDSAGSNHASYSASVPLFSSYQHNQSLSFSGPVTLQNHGTTNLVNPGVDVYLTESRMSYGNSVYLGRSNYTATIAPFPNSIQLLNLGSYFIGSSVPTGVYFPAIYLAASGAADAATGNNSAWGRYENPVTITNVPVLLTPTTTAQTSSLGRIGPLGLWTFRVNAQAGTTYLFSTCGLAAFDTVIALYSSAPAVFADDECGAQSRLTWTAPSTQTVNVVVSGYSRIHQGSFQLEYVIDNDRVFEDGFEM